MKLDKKYGVYMECNIPPEVERKEFDEYIERICKICKMYKDEKNKNWFYIDYLNNYKYENVGSFAHFIAEDKREFHKYISKLILKDSDGLYDYLKGAKKENI
jgi:hypothetical protein